ncbi:MAG TPA: hypothetical protein VMM58_03710 [Bacteroidota bacterium]|nr:hypothetical protein [Bacteroidota bacterium]
MTYLLNILIPVGGFALGGVAGYAFGAFQTAARERNRRLQNGGQLKSNWLIMPGSMTRIALLLILLTSFQLIFPFLFAENGIQWVVSAGVIVGYGWTLLQQIKHRSTYSA